MNLEREAETETETERQKQRQRETESNSNVKLGHPLKFKCVEIKRNYNIVDKLKVGDDWSDNRLCCYLKGSQRQRTFVSPSFIFNYLSDDRVEGFEGLVITGFLRCEPRERTSAHLSSLRVSANRFSPGFIECAIGEYHKTCL